MDKKLFAFCFGICLIPMFILGNPRGGYVVDGSASITDFGNTVAIDQYTDKAIIEWNDFSVREGEITQFIQPTTNSAVLNRVIGNNISEIYGSIYSNGRIYLINHNGVFVGPSGVINTSGFIASTLNISSSEFLWDGDIHAEGYSNSSIINYGSITGFDGDVFLIARDVINEGTINAPYGTAALAGSNSSVILKLLAGKRVSIGYSIGSVDNRGVIEAVQVELQAAGGNPYSFAVNNEGIVTAKRTFWEDGRIFLDGGMGSVYVSGVLENEDGNTTIEGGGGTDAVKLDNAIITTSGYGSINVIGKGRTGVSIINGTKIYSWNGDINIDGYGTGSEGVFVADMGTTISSEGSGVISLYGTSEAINEGTIGVLICDGAYLSTYYGDMVIHGESFGYYDTTGVSIIDFLTMLESKNGIIQLRGSGNFCNIYKKDAVIKDVLGVR